MNSSRFFGEPYSEAQAQPMVNFHSKKPYCWDLRNVSFPKLNGVINIFSILSIVGTPTRCDSQNVLVQDIPACRHGLVHVAHGAQSSF